MEISPQQVRTASFRIAKKGYDSNEVGAFLRNVAEALEAAQNQATAMEARARAAVTRLQELNTAKPDSGPDVSIGATEAETISRTMLLAQRTADATIADAQAEAERVLTAAREEAATTIDSTREMSAALMEEARQEARRATIDARQEAESEVQALLARRDFLEADVDHLERFLVDQRARLREAAAVLIELSEQAPGGLGEVRPPLLSAAGTAATDPGAAAADLDDTGEVPVVPAAGGAPAGDAAAGDAPTGDAATGDAPTGDAATGDTAHDEATAGPAPASAAADAPSTAGEAAGDTGGAATAGDEPTQLFEAVPTPRPGVGGDDPTPPSFGPPPASI